MKTLEEPKGKTLIILISSKPDMLLKTIFSRCQTLKFFRPKELPINSERIEKEREILKEIMPIINSNLADKFKYAKSIDFEEQNLGEILEVMQKHFRNLLLLEAGLPSQAGIEWAGFPAVKKYSIKKIKNILYLIEDINNKILFTNANPKLALEILLMEV